MIRCRCGHVARATIALSLLALAGGPAAANMMLPSFADIVASPLFYSLWLVTIPVAALALLLVTLIEAVVVRGFFPGTRFRTLAGGLFLLNAGTSLAGLLMAPSPGLLPQGFLAAFAATVAAEALLFPLLPFARRLRFMHRIMASVAMNVPSYLVLGAALAFLTYGPHWSTRDPSLLQSAHGTLVSQKDFALRLDRRPLSETTPALPSRGQPIAVAGGGIALMHEDYIDLREPETDNASDAGRILFGRGKLLGVSPDLQKAAVSIDGQLRFVDRRGRLLPSPRNIYPEEPPVLFSRNGRYAALIATNESPHVMWREHQFCLLEGSHVELLSPSPKILSFAFSPVADELAWLTHDGVTILDCSSGKRRFIKMRNHSAYQGSIAWSPDGRLLACIAEFNPFLARAWFQTRANLISADGQRWYPLEVKLTYQWGLQPFLWTSRRL